MDFTLNFAHFKVKVGQNHRFLGIFEGEIPLLIALLVWEQDVTGSSPIISTKLQIHPHTKGAKYSDCDDIRE